MGTKPKKAHIVLHAAADHGPPQVGIAGNVVSNNDELQIREGLLFFQLRLQRGECFDHPHDVLVRADSSGIEQEGISHLVALGNQLAVGRAGVSVKESLVDRVVDHLDAPGGMPNSFSISILVKFETAKMRAAPRRTRLVQ